MKNIARTFIATWYLLGWMFHVYLALFRSGIYQGFGTTALMPGFADLWASWIMPNIRFFALLLALFELTVGLMMIYKGQVVKIGLVLSLAFNLFLLQLGLSYPSVSAGDDFLSNRLPHLFFIILQIPLLWRPFDRSIPEIAIRRWRGEPGS